MRRFLKFDRLAPRRIFGAGLENVIVMYKDLRGFIKQVDDIGALRRINGADPKFELGGITEVAAGTAECPALLFDRIKGYQSGTPVFTNATTTQHRAPLAPGTRPA